MVIVYLQVELSSGSSIPTSRECSYYSNGVRSKSESNVTRTRCISSAKLITNLNSAQINDTETLQMIANEAVRTMEEAEKRLSSSKSSATAHGTTLLHHMLMDPNVKGHTNSTLDRTSKAQDKQTHTHKALRIAEQMDKHLAEIKEK